MKSSKNVDEWNANCDKVKDAHDGGYPDYWYVEIIIYGIVDIALGSAAEIKITPLKFE